jgi:hypothetical protein
MNQSVRFLPEALDDLLETQGWYASREPALAQAFAGAIAYAVERIAQDQAAFPFVHGPVRRLVVRRFPYLITQLAPRRPPRPYRVVHKYQQNHGAQRHPIPERPLAA